MNRLNYQPGVYKSPLAYMEMNLIYYDALKFNQKPVNSKSVLINTAVSFFKALYLVRGPLGCKPSVCMPF